ncbi:hypothetical protein EIP91_005892 [Steccherinum ochraceum]|uniref:Uncharacterized protein n=1 Tax=Steccherinum ochraceum TaxID=92696 RepID=A0A4R0RLH8_9APHY|nr:hypothetical protein EIP91_005892 [Steccherinum ochraceum]
MLMITTLLLTVAACVMSALGTPLSFPSCTTEQPHHPLGWQGIDPLPLCARAVAVDTPPPVNPLAGYPPPYIPFHRRTWSSRRSDIHGLSGAIDASLDRHGVAAVRARNVENIRGEGVEAGIWKGGPLPDHIHKLTGPGSSR